VNGVGRERWIRLWEVKADEAGAGMGAGEGRDQGWPSKAATRSAVSGKDLNLGVSVQGFLQ
jgi:hypothetical protein